MTIEELARFDGVDGRATYVAVNGIIYDISSSQLWQSGRHEGGHKAGQDLTEELQSAPHLRTAIERFPVVGKIENKDVVSSIQNGIVFNYTNVYRVSYYSVFPPNR